MRGFDVRASIVAALALVLTASGCKRCGGESGAVDAAFVDAGPATSPLANGTITGIDLRSAMILMLPEFRGANVHGARAWVERTLKSPTPIGPLEPLLSDSVKQKGFTDVTVDADGALHAKRPPFELTAKKVTDTGIVETMSVRLTPEEVQKLYTAPTSLGSEQLEFMLPRPSGLTSEKDLLLIELAYVAKVDRANFLVRQLVEGLVGIGWVPDAPLDWPGRKEDGGVGDIPLQTQVIVRRTDSGGSLRVVRNGGEVYLLYTQPLSGR